ncbi:DUF3549 family protein [Vibrio sp. JC009]|uniref:DUF3549 family protein n=1 Tax=Vibrio sp. JC009 TaxID=2912314 RepID=UPI0023B081F1|nr:DUF3549 family protein [Vibrio sp. JC009]WED21189.1 DUF3549 family protein [Vibrio sp. JC009]
MENSQTLSELLENSGCQYKVFDLGRRIQPIENEQFSKIESGHQPYPYPMQRQAHLAIAYWNETKQPWIWFLQFPLDERGLFKQSDIGNFIKYVVEAMGSRLVKELDEETEQTLANNPYTFKPKEDKLAVFHSMIRASMQMQTSQYYQHAQDYFSGKLGWSNWQTVGLQGITDICTRTGQDQNALNLQKALRHLPNEPLYALLGALEHVELPEKLAQKLTDMSLELCSEKEPDLFLLSALVRSLSGAPKELLEQVVKAILASPLLSHQEVLIGIAGRAWQSLENSQLAETFLLRLAQTGNQTLFNQLFADLVMIPNLRLVFLPLLHSNPSKELAQALLKLQQATRTGTIH